MPKIFLSVDLDFWDKDDTSRHSARSGMRFVEKCCGLNVPISFHAEHQDILKHANKISCDKLLNVDRHDDLIGFKSLEDFHHFMRQGPDDYNWVNFVEWRRKASYLWVYPMKNLEMGICDPIVDAYAKREYQGWGDVGRRRISAPKALERFIPWEEVLAVGIVVSPSFFGNRNLAEDVLSYLGVAKPYLNLEAPEDLPDALEALLDVSQLSS